MNDMIEGIIKGNPLIKIHRKEIIEKTQKGSFYMNSLQYYRDLYHKYEDDVIGDPHEGQLYIPEAVVRIQRVSDGEIYHEQIQDSSLAMPSSNDFVYCMFGIQEKNSSFSFSDEQREKLLQAYDTVLLILDSEEYIRRITKSLLKNGRNVCNDFVKYFDEKCINQDLLCKVKRDPSMLSMYKRSKYAYQQEYRFVVKREEDEKNCKFKEFFIGDISDISEIHKAEVFFETFRAEFKGIVDGQC